MTDQDLDQVRTEVLQQLADSRERIPLTTPAGANYHLGLCFGLLLRLRRGLLTPSQVAELAEQVHAEFTQHWPQINPDYMDLLMKLYAEKDTLQ